MSIQLFDEQTKRLAKKYPTIKNDLAKLFKSLEANPNQGTSLGNNFYKIRLAISESIKYLLNNPILVKKRLTEC